jgi:hypothetical protein
MSQAYFIGLDIVKDGFQVFSAEKDTYSIGMFPPCSPFNKGNAFQSLDFF